MKQTIEITFNDGTTGEIDYVKYELMEELSLLKVQQYEKITTYFNLDNIEAFTVVE